MRAAAREASERDAKLPLPLFHRGKVRDVYEVGTDRLLLVASDRISAFDVIMAEPIPSKGEVLTLITDWWLDRLAHSQPHHRITTVPARLLELVPELGDTPRELWARRSMLVTRTRPLPVECVIRGYLSGSAWKEYRDRGTLAGEALPPGMVESDRLQSPLFSPATKAAQGHDENIPIAAVVAQLGSDMATELERRSQEVYAFGAHAAAARGILLADTKFEFGIDGNGRLLLIDEVLTPDSSRYWPADLYAAGQGQPSLDKQPVRDYLEGLHGWDKTPPPPALPDSVIEQTADRYRRIFRLLTGTPLNEYVPTTVHPE